MSKKFIFIIIFLACVACIDTSAQTVDCPANRVCITEEQARHYLTLEDTMKAKDAEILALKKAVLDQREITVDTKIALATAIGEKTGLEQSVVRLTAENQFLLKNGRKRCAPFAICF